ncbi:IS3 family transposase [Streptomyces sp. H27-H5]
MAESFFGALKNERVSRVTYLTREAARQDITRYIELCTITSASTRPSDTAHHEKSTPNTWSCA